jgi:hypothetical protein
LTPTGRDITQSRAALAARDFTAPTLHTALQAATTAQSRLVAELSSEWIKALARSTELTQFSTTVNEATAAVAAFATQLKRLFPDAGAPENHPANQAPELPQGATVEQGAKPTAAIEALSLTGITV